MGRKQTIFVDRNAMLANVCHLWNATLAEFDAGVADGKRRVKAANAVEREAWKACEADMFNHQLREVHRRAMLTRRDEDFYLQHQEQGRKNFLEAEWLPYDLHAITGRMDLTPSERLRTNQALRAMDAEGLVVIDGRRATAIKPTKAGLARAAELQAADAATNV